MMTPIEL